MEHSRSRVRRALIDITQRGQRGRAALGQLWRRLRRLDRLSPHWRFGLVVGTLALGGLLVMSVASLRRNDARSLALDKRTIAALLGSRVEASKLPETIDLEVDQRHSRARLTYTLEPVLQNEMERLFRQYRPDYGAFVAMDARTGRILSLVSYGESESERGAYGNLALRAGFPSASVFKVVTAAAAISERQYTGASLIAFNGRNHTLYRGNVLKQQFNRWTRWMSLEDAFALSVNTVFGKLGVFELGADRMREYASRFFFDRPIPSDLPVQTGRAAISETTWSLAEAASGFTRHNTMSPMHGAMIAGAVVNGGVMMEPYVVESVSIDDEASPRYHASPRIAGAAMDVATAAEMRKLMQATVRKGTSRSSFRGFGRSRPLRALASASGGAEIEVGGKTGSLTGRDPVGKYDWFVGYAEAPGGERIAVAAMTVHENYWRVKSAYLARMAFETYFARKR